MRVPPAEVSVMRRVHLTRQSLHTHITPARPLHIRFTPTSLFTPLHTQFTAAADARPACRGVGHAPSPLDTITSHPYHARFTRASLLLRTSHHFSHPIHSHSRCASRLPRCRSCAEST
eukprot:scaffold457_cov111-Isochrysis_galbana.AAC.3